MVELVVSTHLKNLLVKLDHFPRDRDENKKSLSCHHPVVRSFLEACFLLGKGSSYLRESTPKLKFGQNSNNQIGIENRS